MAGAAEKVTLEPTDRDTITRLSSYYMDKECQYPKTCMKAYPSLPGLVGVRCADASGSRSTSAHRRAVTDE